MAAFFNSGTYRCKWRLAFGNGFKSGPNHIILKTSENNWLSPICPTFDSRDVIRMREYPYLLRDIFPTSPLISLIFMTSQASKVGQIGLRQLIVLFRSRNWALFLRLFWCQAFSHYEYFCHTLDISAAGSISNTFSFSYYKNYIILAYHWSIKMYPGLPLVI